MKAMKEEKERKYICELKQDMVSGRKNNSNPFANLHRATT